jgi:nucleotide-binding universal stress UspA family protein
MIRRIVVPLDFSERSLAALDLALEVGAPTKQVTLVHAVESLAAAAPVDGTGAAANLALLQDQQEAVADRELARIQQRLERRGIRARRIVAMGVPKAVILEAAKKVNADLIAMGTHGRTGLRRVLLGSVAESVVREAPCPVLTVGPSRQKRHRAKRASARRRSTSRR